MRAGHRSHRRPSGDFPHHRMRALRRRYRPLDTRGKGIWTGPEHAEVLSEGWAVARSESDVSAGRVSICTSSDACARARKRPGRE